MEANLRSFTDSSSPPLNDSSRVAFNSAASSYDAHFESFPATRRLRSLIQARLLSIFKTGDSVLELNCGTGTDALFLARHGIRVHATDGSPAMVEIVRAKAKDFAESSLVTTAVLPFDKLRTADLRPFDGAFSNLGGLNCCHDLAFLAESLGKLIKPGGYLLVCLLGCLSPWEISSFILRGKLGDARRRLNATATTVHVQGVSVPIRYYSNEEIRRAFQPTFTIRYKQGLNIITPPPASVDADRRLGWILQPLQWIEDRICSLPPFNRLGDHVLIVLERQQ